jgi:digeranylgeranylglycerophospholipid reductase
VAESLDAAFDVAVIGAGPTGSFAAERMARGGLAVALFEKDARPGDSTVCAGGMNADVGRFIDLPADLVEKVLPVLRLTCNGRSAEWRFAKAPFLTVERRRLDALLAERATRAGATLFTEARVVAVSPERGALDYESGAARTPRQAHAKAFVFADGPGSLARRVIPHPRERKDASRYVAVEYDLAGSDPLDALEIVTDGELLPFGYAWVFPKREHVNVGVAVLSATATAPPWKLLDQLLARRPDLRARAVLHRKGGVIPALVMPRVQQENCLVIGDAAGMVNPLTAGGYVCGFLSAALAAETCVEAFRDGQLDVRVLCRYPRRLRRTRHYRFLRAASVCLRLVLVLYRVRGRSLYPSLLRAYFGAMRLTMPFVRAI